MSFFLAAATVSDLDGRARKYLLGRSFCYWQDGGRANGTIIWGKPLEQDIAEMELCWNLGTDDPDWEGHAVFIDARGVEGVDAFAFRRLLNYLATTQHALRNVGSVTMVHDGGLVGVVTAGLLSVVRPAYPFGTVTGEALRGAFAKLGVEDLYAPVEALRQRVGTAPEIVRAVQAALRRLPGATAAQLADYLNLSERTLQRRLDGAGSSLRHERTRHVMLQAEELLAATSLDLDAIAAQVGLASASHLVAYFQRVHAMTPREWRERNRR